MRVEITMTSGEKRVVNVPHKDVVSMLKDLPNEVKFWIIDKTVFIIDNIQCIDIID